VTNRYAKLTEHLAAIPPLFARLPQFIRPGSRPADPDRVTTSTSPARPPLNLDVLDLLDLREKADAEATRGDYDLDRRAGGRRQGILPTLSSWVRLVDGERWDEGDEHQNPPTQRTVEGECGWLTEGLDWITEQKWANELEQDLQRMVADMRRACGESPEVPLTCSKCRWLVEPRDGGAWYVCTGCNWTWTMANEIDRLLQAQTDIMDAATLPEIAANVGRPVSTVKEWKARGWLLPVGKTKRGYVYDVKAAQRVAESVKVERGKRRIA
jgi:hypothetical protein